MRILLIICVFLANTANAGAWLQDPQKQFLSAGSEVSYSYDTQMLRSTTEMYWEIGLRKNLTFGANLSLGQYGAPSSGEGFVRLPLWKGDKGAVASAQFAIGMYEEAFEAHPTIKAGLSWGKGFSTKLGNGWINVDSTLTLKPNSGNHSAKIDATLGISPRERLKIMLQTAIEHPAHGDLDISFTPSAAIAFGENQHLQLSATPRSDSIKLKAAIWKSF